jgi:hypothetical protein
VVRVALRRIRVWQDKPEQPVSCPLCEAPGLKIEDRSTRPYSEWYILSCPSCGLDDKIHVPSAARSP